MTGSRHKPRKSNRILARCVLSRIYNITMTMGTFDYFIPLHAFACRGLPAISDSVSHLPDTITQGSRCLPSARYNHTGKPLFTICQIQSHREAAVYHLPDTTTQGGRC